MKAAAGDAPAAGLMMYDGRLPWSSPPQHRQYGKEGVEMSKCGVQDLGRQKIYSQSAVPTSTYPVTNENSRLIPAWRPYLVSQELTDIRKQLSWTPGIEAGIQLLLSLFLTVRTPSDPK